ncbi:hypothetical protein KUTeg_007527, partial [Tegillarca granosa]
MFDHQHAAGYIYGNNTRPPTHRTSITQGETSDPDSEPKGSQYLNPNCILLTYFNGDISTVVDEHFSRALSQPSSFTLEKNGDSSQQSLRKTDSALMCHRKLPPSFWNSSYQPPKLSPGPTYCAQSSSDYTRDAYLASSWYPFSNNWPYHFPSQAYSGPSELSRTFPYSSFDSTSKLNPSYSSLMLRGGFGDHSRNSKYDVPKLSDSLPGSSGYYALQRLGTDISTNFEPSTSENLNVAI